MEVGGGMTRKVLCAVSYSFLCFEVFQLVYEAIQCYRKRKTTEHRKPSHLWNTVIFFPEKLNKLSSRNQLLWYLSQAERSIKICMYSISSVFIEAIIDERRSKGVNIEIITMNPRTAENLHLKGYTVKVKPTKDPDIDGLMHHKFVIIDYEAIITGSLNWTAEGFGGNNENVLITTNSKAVEKYLGEFERLWTLCKRPLG